MKTGPDCECFLVTCHFPAPASVAFLPPFNFPSFYSLPGVLSSCPFCSLLIYTYVSFLDDIDRIATRTYEPSDDDVVRARLRTLGVQEYNIQFEQSKGPTLFSGASRLSRSYVLP